MPYKRHIINYPAKSYGMYENVIVEGDSLMLFLPGFYGLHRIFGQFSHPVSKVLNSVLLYEPLRCRKTRRSVIVVDKNDYTIKLIGVARELTVGSALIALVSSSSAVSESIDLIRFACPDLVELITPTRIEGFELACVKRVSRKYLPYDMRHLLLYDYHLY